MPAVRSSLSSLHPYLRGQSPLGKMQEEIRPQVRKSQEGKAHVSVLSVHLLQTQGKGGAKLHRKARPEF